MLKSGALWCVGEQVTYAVPFRRGDALAGVVTLDLRYDQELRLCFAAKGSQVNRALCWSCGLGKQRGALKDVGG